MTDPRQPAYDAVFAYIRSQPRDFVPATVVDRNAMIWRAVQAALDAAGVPGPEEAPAPAATEATEPASCPVDHCDPDHCGIHTRTGCGWRDPATEPATALTEVLARLHPYHRVGDPAPIGYQTVNTISPADYNRWNAALHPASGDDPPVQCWHTEAGTPCDSNACHQPDRIAAGDYGTDPREPSHG